MSEIERLAERFGTRTQACAEYVAEEFTLDEMRAMLGPIDALEMAWPGGAAGRGGNMNQLPKAVAMKVRKLAESKMGASERRNSLMWA